MTSLRRRGVTASRRVTGLPPVTGPTMSTVEPDGSSTSSSVVVPAPSGIVSGNLLLAFVRLADNTWLNEGDVTAPTGWTLLRIDSDNPSSSFRSHQGVYVKTAGSSEPATYTWDRGSTSYWAVDLHNIPDHAGVDVHGGNGDFGVSALELPSVTATGDGTLYAAWSAWRGGRSGKWGDAPSGMTELWNAPEEATANVMAAMTAKEAVPSGATGTRTASRVEGDVDRLCGSVVVVAS